MSADNGLVVQRNSKGKIVVQHFSMSSESYPDPNEATVEYDLIEDAVLANADNARDTEYGFFFNTVSLIDEESGE